MDRDMDVIRKILLASKEAEKTLTSLDGVDDKVFAFNANLLLEAGLAHGVPHTRQSDPSGLPSQVFINRLTWDGFDFADAMSDDTIWKKAKENVIQPTASWTFGLLMEYLKAEARINLGIPS